MSVVYITMLIAKNNIFGPPEVVQVVEAPDPIPGKGEILIRVHYSSVSVADSRLRSRNVPRGFGFIMGLLFGFRRPSYASLGTEAVGVVTKRGESVSQFYVGDRVVANLGMKLGGHSQYIVLKESAPIAKIPDAVSDEVAAAMVFGGTTALSFLREKLQLKQGEKLLVIGAAGAVGSAAVQIGKLMGASVAGVCSSGKASAVLSLGADRVIDYEKTDWRLEPQKYDVILDCVGGLSFSVLNHALSPQGRAGLVVADLPQTLQSAWVSLFQKQKIIAGPISEKREDLQHLLELCRTEKFKPLIGKIFPLDQIVDAHRLVDSGHKLGSVLIKL